MTHWIQDNVDDWFKAYKVTGGWITESGEFIEDEFIIFSVKVSK